MDKIDRVLKITRWAKDRYTINGRLITWIGGKPSIYSRIVNAAINKYLLTNPGCNKPDITS